MRVPACLVAVVLAGGPAAATPILIDDITTTGLLPTEHRLTHADSTDIGPDGITHGLPMPATDDTSELVMYETQFGVLDVVDDDAIAVSRHLMALLESPADPYADRDARAQASHDASTVTESRDVERATMSHVQPAALTLLGVCLFLVAAGSREWQRRNWHRRHRHRRR